MSMKFTNYEEIDKFLADMINKAPVISRKILEILAQKLVDKINLLAPKHTGKYAASWSIGERSDIRITIETPLGLLYIILEFQGRREGKISAKEAESLHFQINGVDVFVKSVWHPGFPPMPHARPALKVIMNEAMSVVVQVVKQEVPLFRGV